DGGNNIISGSYLGLEPDGSTAAGNAFGVYLCASSNNRIGGTTAAERNVISGNSDGIRICGPFDETSSDNNIIQGNYIGLNAAGDAVVANNDDGIDIYNSTGTLIGGTASGARNVISGNDFRGISISGGGSHIIQGNYIGPNAAGTSGF